MAITEPKATSSTITATRPDDLLALGHVLGGLGGKVAAQLHPDGARPVGGLGGGLESLVGPVADVVRRAVVLHAGVGDAAVRGDLELTDGAHVGLGGHVGQRGVDGTGGAGVGERSRRTVLDREHELRRRAGGGRELLL